MTETIDRKRLRENDHENDGDNNHSNNHLNENNISLATAAKKRRSRFDRDAMNETISGNNSNGTETKDKIAEAISSASAKAALLSRELSTKGPLLGIGLPIPSSPLSLSSSSSSSSIFGLTPSIIPPISTNQTTEEKMAQAAEMQRQLTAQMASVSSMLSLVNKGKTKGDRKAAYRPLLLDEQGRQIDEQGNVIKFDIQQVKTLAANVSEIKKKENPYLSQSSVVDESISLDERLVVSSREQRAKKALKFVEAGTFINLEDRIRTKEERKIIAGYASGRKAPELIGESVDNKNTTNSDGNNDSDGNMATKITSSHNISEKSLPAPVDGGVVPSMEWWDEIFLPKDLREQRKASKASAEIDNYDKVLLSNCKTYKYIQHPVPIKPLGGEAPEAPLPMYLTKKERKRIRKQTRAAREQEKRDKLMLGLIPAPEPKFKLSNFMKILGDQAIADPSKVEMKVIEQMQKRQLNHEMRNLAAKLTPAERKAKMIRKNQEDTSRQVHTAVFRIKDFTNPKHRFKVDVNAQQFFLTGTVILCLEGDCNLVIVEGGPRGIRRFTRLMLERIKWSDKIVPLHSDSYGNSMVDSSMDIEGGDSNSNNDNNNDDSDDDDEDDNHNHTDNENKMAKSNKKSYKIGASSEENGELSNWNYCKLVWQGIIPKRIFTGFRFQECKNQVISKKLLESKNVSHYWDMSMQLHSTDLQLP